MRNYDQKIKDMTESVLPSTARVGARRTRAAIHRRDRHLVRQQLHMIVDPTDPACSDEVLGHDARRELADMIDDRRTADKVGSLERWAERRVVTDPSLASASFDERVAYFRRLLPDNTIGRHALDHIRFVVRYLDDGQRPRRSTPGTREPTVRELALREAATTVLANGLHGVLNKRLKNEAWTVTTSRSWIEGRWERETEMHAPRLLAGFHDVDAFAKAATHQVAVITHDLARRALAEPGTFR